MWNFLFSDFPVADNIVAQQFIHELFRGMNITFSLYLLLHVHGQTGTTSNAFTDHQWSTGHLLKTPALKGWITRLFPCMFPAYCSCTVLSVCTVEAWLSVLDWTWMHYCKLCIFLKLRYTIFPSRCLYRLPIQKLNRKKLIKNKL